MSEDYLRPLGTKPLPEGSLACWSCGIAVAVSDPAGILKLPTDYKPPRGSAEGAQLAAERTRWQVERGGSSAPGVGFPTFSFEFTTCDTCVALRTAADQLAKEHPAVQRWAGSVLRDRLRLALTRLDVLGVEVPELDDRGVWNLQLTMGGGDGGEWIEKQNELEAKRNPIPPAGPLYWYEQFSPTLRKGVDPTSCGPERWAHVDAELRQVARKALARWLAARTDRPVAVECPSGGCAWCGVGSVTVMKSAAAMAWSANQGGHFCPTCNAVHEYDVSNGPLDAFWSWWDPDQEIRKRWPERPDIRGLKPWRDTGREPNATPWAHTGNLEALRNELAPKSDGKVRWINLEEGYGLTVDDHLVIPRG